MSDRPVFSTEEFREFARETILNLQRVAEEAELALKRAKALFREFDENGADDLDQGR